jgi:D-galactarolactone isomerase
MDNVRAIGETARAVVVVPRGTDEAELQRLTDAGARGLRVFMLKGGVYGWEELPELAAMVKPFGWHLQVQLDGRELIERMDLLMNLDAQLVIDHTGKFLEPVEIDHPAFTCLRRLVPRGCLCQALGTLRDLEGRPATYDDIGIPRPRPGRGSADRMLWATKLAASGPRPQGRRHAARHLLDWAPKEAQRKMILADNPARLYGFTSAGAAPR